MAIIGGTLPPTFQLVGPPLIYHKLYGDVQDLKFATRDSACMDVCAYFGTKEKMFSVWNNENVKLGYMAFQMTHQDPVHTVLNPGDRALVPTGIVLDIPEGFSVRIHPRSGMAIKQGLILANCEGVIDSDYVEQLYVPVWNISSKPLTINHGDRIAQLEMVQQVAYNLSMSEERPKPKTDRKGGFGSTGVA